MSHTPMYTYYTRALSLFTNIMHTENPRIEVVMSQLSVACDRETQSVHIIDTHNHAHLHKNNIHSYKVGEKEDSIISIELHS